LERIVALAKEIVHAGAWWATTIVLAISLAACSEIGRESFDRAFGVDMGSTEAELCVDASSKIVDQSWIQF
jgi:hypothetical protein